MCQVSGVRCHGLVFFFLHYYCEQLSCDLCDFDASSLDNLKMHKVTVHGNQISDQDIEIMGGKILTNHYCTVCKFVAENIEDLNIHNQIHRIT